MSYLCEEFLTMESKLNLGAIQLYSKEFAQVSCTGFFQNQDKIKGPEILKFTELDQLNLMIVKKLFERWQTGYEEFKSPFFNFQADPVQSALKKFLNTLSQHIEVAREDFEVVVAEAVEDTLLLIFSPYDYYRKEILNHFSGAEPLEGIKKIRKYIKVNGHLWDEFILRCGAKGPENGVDGAYALFDEVLNETQEPPAEFDKCIQALSVTAPFDLRTIYLEQETAEPLSEEGRNLNDNYSWDKPTVNDRLATDSQPNPTVLQKSSKIEDLKSSISVNQRFMFVKELFHGDEQQFNQAIEKLESLSDHDEAIEFIKSSHATEHNWDMESEEAQEFFGLVQQRFQ